MGRGIIILMALMIAYALVRGVMAHYRREALRKAREESLIREKEQAAAREAVQRDRTRRENRPQRIVEARYRDVDSSETDMSKDEAPGGAT